MKQRHKIIARWQRVCLAALLVTVSFICHPISAQDTDTDGESVTLARPLVVFNLASYDKMLSELGYIFETVERPDVMESMTERLDERLSSLKGVSKDQPMGVMLFLRGGFPPKVEPILYVPVENVDEAIETVQTKGSLVKKVEEDFYKVVTPSETRYVKLQDKYAFIFLGDDDVAEEVLDRKFPNPSGYTKRMSRQYDFGISLDLTSVPSGMKQLGMGFLRAQAATEMQQRDDEPEGLYVMRRAQAERMIEGLDLMLKHGERLEFGIDASQEERVVKLEFQLDARKDSPLAKNIDEMNSKRSHFTKLFDENAAFTVSTSAKFEDLEREMYLKVVDGGELELLRLIEEEKPEINPEVVTSIMGAVRQSIKMQHFDGFLQCYGQPPELKAVGGIRLKNGESIATKLPYLVEQLKDDPLFSVLASVEVNKDTHQNVAFHKLPSVGDRGSNIVGANPGVYVGISSQVLWFAIGGDSAMDQLKTTMDTLALPSDQPRSVERPPAMRLVFNAKQWLGLAKTKDESEIDQEDQRAVRRAGWQNKRTEILKSAFEDGDDRLEIDVRPVESGLRVQLKLDEGFVRLIGGMVATGFDFRQRMREEGGGEGRQRFRGRPTGDE